jgi:hypothetical protein
MIPLNSFLLASCLFAACLPLHAQQKLAATQVTPPPFFPLFEAHIFSSMHINPKSKFLAIKFLAIIHGSYPKSNWTTVGL